MNFLQKTEIRIKVKILKTSFALSSHWLMGQMRTTFSLLVVSFIKLQGVCQINLCFIFLNHKYIAMATFTSSLPDDLLQQLSAHAKKLAVPKNALIEKALRIYLEQLTRAEYIQSYKRAAEDEHILQIAEEGMHDYFRQLEETDQSE